jgi:hypothetical protein
MYFKAFEDNMHKLYKFDIKYKDRSLFMKFLGFILFFSKSFMANFVSTIGSTIYFPSEAFVKNNDQTSILLLAHELVHVQQANKYGKILFGLLYLFPQCLVILALLAPLSLWFLLFLICAAPLPAPFRTYFEIEAYAMSLFALNSQLKFLKNKPDKIAELLSVDATKIDSKYFKSSAYWFMWPFGISGKLENKIKDIQDDVISRTDAIYDCVRQSYLSATSQ